MKIVGSFYMIISSKKDILTLSPETRKRHKIVGNFSACFLTLWSDIIYNKFKFKMIINNELTFMLLRFIQLMQMITILN